MAKKKETQEPSDGVLVAAAKSIGAATGKIVAAVGLTPPQKVKIPKLVSKNKSRLPRRQKKAEQKAAKGTKRAARVKGTG